MSRVGPLLVAAVVMASAVACSVDPGVDREFTAEPSPNRPSPPSKPRSTTPKGPEEAPPPPPWCPDPDTTVIAGCLDALDSITPLPGGRGALVTERLTGRILTVIPGRKPTEFARVPVEATGDGGLTGIALSPTFSQDRLVFAYVTSGTENKVVRIAPGDAPKDIVGGIPRGPAGNRGALAISGDGDLLILTGAGGTGERATDPGSLGGKLLRIPADAAPGSARPEVLASGFEHAGGICVDTADRTVWLTGVDAAGPGLHRFIPGTGIEAITTWSGDPSIAGCAATSATVAVLMGDGRRAVLVRVDPATGAMLSEPGQLIGDEYGRLVGAMVDTEGAMWATTGNKPGVTTSEFDDRVLRLPAPQSPSGGGNDRD